MAAKQCFLNCQTEMRFGVFIDAVDAAYSKLFVAGSLCVMFQSSCCWNLLSSGRHQLGGLQEAHTVTESAKATDVCRARTSEHQTERSTTDLCILLYSVLCLVLCTVLYSHILCTVCICIVLYFVLYCIALYSVLYVYSPVLCTVLYSLVLYSVLCVSDSFEEQYITRALGELSSTKAGHLVYIQVQIICIILNCILESYSLFLL